MRALFLLVALVSGAAVLLRRRRFDFFSVAYLGSCVYFLPAFLGVAADVNLGTLATAAVRPVQPTVYGILATVLGAIGLGALLFDELGAARGDARRGPRAPARGGRELALAPHVALVVALVGFVATVLTLRSELLNPDKHAVLSELGRGYVLWATGAPVALLLGLEARARGVALIAALLIVADVYVGSRSAAAMAVIGTFVLVLGRQGPVVLLSPRMLAWGLAGLAVGGAFFVYKGVYIAVKSGAFGLVRERLFDPEFYEETVLYSSEPFLVLGTLNEVVRTGFEVPADHYLGLVNAAVPFGPELGAEVVSFNDRFQPALFPDRQGGLAGNFLAEAWSVAGWPAVIGVTLLYVAGVWLGSSLLGARSAALRSLALVAAPSWSFYVHRNDLFYQLLLERRVVLAFLAAAVASAVAVAAIRGRRVRRPVALAPPAAAARGARP